MIVNKTVALAAASGAALAASLLVAPAVSTASAAPAAPASKDIPAHSLSCPKDAPNGTLRGKAKGKNVHKLCTQAVRNAPTNVAKHAVIYAFNQLGKPYLCGGEPNAHLKRLEEDAFDPSSLIYHAYRYAGVSTGGIGTSRNIIPWDGVPQTEWVRTLPDGARAKPGDINGYLYPSRKDPSWGHVTLVVGKQLIIQADSCGDGVHVTSRQPDGKYKTGTYRAVPRIPRPAR